MFIEFFFKLRAARIPVSTTELLTLLEALNQRLVGPSVDEFYYLSRMALVKDERYYDRFDRVFSAHFNALEDRLDSNAGELVEEWLRNRVRLHLSEEERQRLSLLSGWQNLPEMVRERFQQQSSRHRNDNKWNGTSGDASSRACTRNPNGIRIHSSSRYRGAAKVWSKRAYRHFDDSVELGRRNIKLALRKLRRFAREGAAQQLDLSDTIRSTARDAGLLQIKMVPERHNVVKVLLFLDIDGSMDDHIQICQELFSAARSEFKHLAYFYYHNFPYEAVWKDVRRRDSDRILTMEVIHKYGPDYKLIFVGDATMSTYEISYRGGSLEHWNEEPGATWITRLLSHYRYAIWLNPQSETRWEYTPSIRLTRKLMGGRLYPLTLAGLEQGIKTLKQKQ